MKLEILLNNYRIYEFDEKYWQTTSATCQIIVK